MILLAALAAVLAVAPLAGGDSHAAKGRGVCHAGQCEFLIAVPVRSFDSGDSNRDLHMIQAVRGGQFPMVTVRTRLPEEASASSTIQADLEIQFAGQTATYRQVPFERSVKDNSTRVSGTIPAKLSDFKIDPPALFAVAVKNEMPVRVEMTWRRENWPAAIRTKLSGRTGCGAGQRRPSRLRTADLARVGRRSIGRYQPEG